jgi:multidrug efflux system membrane fusion protein
LPQIALPDLRAVMAKGDVEVVARVGDAKLSGKVAFIENTVDAATGTITVKAEIANPNEQLWPGAFAAVEVLLGTEPNAVVVAAAAIQLGPQGPFVFTLKDKNIAELRPVQVKRTVAGEAVIGEGLKVGDTVVVDGQLRLVNGATVSIRDDKAPAQAASPPRS